MEENISLPGFISKYFKKRYICDVLFVCFLLAVIALSFFWAPILKFLKGNPTFCLQDEDAQDQPPISANWSELIDFSADPCQDFYSFSCGLQKEIKPKCSIIKDQEKFEKEMEKIGMFASRDVIQQCLNESIYTKSHNGSTAIQKFQLFRDTYSKGSKNKDLTVQELVDNIRSFGGCPAIKQTQWNPDTFNLTYTLQKLTNLTAEMHLFKWWTGRLENSTFVLTIEAEDPTKYRFTNDQVYLLGDALELLNTFDGPTDTYVNYNRTAAKIVNVYREIMGVYEKFNDTDIGKEDDYGFKIPPKMDADLEAVSFDTINRALPIVGTRYFLENVYVSPQLHSHLSTNPHIYFNKKQLLFELNDFYAQLEPDRLANFLCAQYLMSQLEFLDLTPFNETHTELVKKLEDEIEEIDEDLLDSMSGVFFTVVDHLFISHCLSPNTYDRIKLMLKEIESIVHQTIQRQTWIDTQTKDAILHKLNKMKTNILGVDLVRDVKKLDSFHETLEFDSNDSLRKMGLKAISFLNKRVLELPSSNKYHDLLETFVFRASTTNAVYIPTFNSLSIFAGVLFPPSYKSNRLDALNYGAIGSTIGHEFSHAFQLLGQKFGPIGERRQLFTQQASNNFMERAKCFIDQYNQFEDKEVGEFIENEGANLATFLTFFNKRSAYSSKLNGTRTLEENLSDNFGIRLSYEAYKIHLKGRVEPKLTEFPQFTNDQLFFLSYGSMWCNNFSVLERFIMLVFDTHSPPKARVNMVMQNFEPFAKAFNCPIESPMNPVKKCQMWE